MSAANIQNHVRVLAAFSPWLHRETYTVQNILNSASLLLFLDTGLRCSELLGLEVARQGGDRVPPVPMEGALAKPESTEGGRRVSVLRRQEGAPVLLG